MAVVVSVSVGEVEEWNLVGLSRYCFSRAQSEQETGRPCKLFGSYLESLRFKMLGRVRYGYLVSKTNCLGRTCGFMSPAFAIYD